MPILERIIGIYCNVATPPVVWARDKLPSRINEGVDAIVKKGKNEVTKKKVVISFLRSIDVAAQSVVAGLDGMFRNYTKEGAILFPLHCSVVTNFLKLERHANDMGMRAIRNSPYMGKWSARNNQRGTQGKKKNQKKKDVAKQVDRSSTSSNWKYAQPNGFNYSNNYYNNISAAKTSNYPTTNGLASNGPYGTSYGSQSAAKKESGKGESGKSKGQRNNSFMQNNPSGFY